jgi:Flp pilus assembly CpaF family ATPase
MDAIMSLPRIAFTMLILLAISTLAYAAEDPIKVNLTPKKHATNSAAIEVTACIPSANVACKMDPNTPFDSAKDRNFGIRVQSESTPPSIDDAVASIRKMPNVMLRNSARTTDVVVVWDRRL